MDNINNDEKKANIITKTIKKVFNKNDGEFTAERAWLSTTYGESANLPIETRIINKQKSIKDIIKSKFRYNTGGCIHDCSSYRCIIDVEEDLVSHSKEILQPFIDGGFKVINLSERIDEIKEENVYLISWKNAFTKE